MKNKKESFREERILSLPTILLFILYAVILLAFFFLLDKQTNAGFGLAEILFAIVSAGLMTGIFAGSAYLMRSNIYLGSVFGIIFIFALVYALFMRFRGPYTTMFAVIGSIIGVIYLIYSFIITCRENRIKNK